ncbi:hypothetical protein CARUB_v10006366mg [Capsella rubella]|uniref:Oxidoreductase FAD/NAD(P)-binding domain-containing protein n=1 Tax=Capsella rubella TaxID=81985 RepID=R0H379_9BRAS|nr:hypothetical protein CARUB_v10006366mg [Capsella rubella]
MLLPEKDPKATHIMIATGTRVALYRGYLRRMFMENVPSKTLGGLAWLFFRRKIEECNDEIFKPLDNGAHVYFCGIIGMMPGIQDTLKRVAEERGKSWDLKLSQLRKNKKWHIEVY